MNNTGRNKMVHALRFKWLTPFYDFIVGATTREKVFKKALIEQSRVREGQQVLDIACGTGTLAILIKQSQPESIVTAVDGDESILSIAIKKTEKECISITYDQAFSDQLPYENHKFDLIVSSLFFHHLNWDAKQRTAKEIFRILKPGGELHIADWGCPSNSFMRIAFYLIQMLDGFENTQDNVSGKLIILFKEAGFINVSSHKSFNTVFGTLTLYSATKE